MVEAKVDDRNRVAIPARFVDSLRALSLSADSQEPLEVVISLDLMGKLAVFPNKVYSDFREHLTKQDPYSFQSEGMRTLILGSSERQTLDKQSRIRIPNLLGKRKGLKGEIVIQGVGNRLQFLSMEDWEKSLDAYDEQVDQMRMAEVRKMMGG